MATLSAKQRASLPDSAFAYVDSQGSRKLPIPDEAHVRNALSRFGQVRFESEEARERAFRKLLEACAKYGIAPVGFVTRRLREAQRGAAPSDKPLGRVTLMMADIENSTSLAASLREQYPALLEYVRTTMRSVVTQFAGYEVDARGDEFFAAFAGATEAVGASVSIQREIDADRVRVRIGLHTGQPSVTDTGYEGLAVNYLSRVAFAGHGRQIVCSETTASELADRNPPGIRLEPLGHVGLRGLEGRHLMHQVEAEGLPTEFPPLRVSSS